VFTYDGFVHWIVNNILYTFYTYVYSAKFFEEQSNLTSQSVVADSQPKTFSLSNFATLLHGLTTENDWTQADLARKMGVTPAMAKRYLDGDREPRHRRALKIARNLQLQEADLVRFIKALKGPPLDDDHLVSAVARLLNLREHLSPIMKERLVLKLEDLISTYDSRDKRVRSAVVPIAGWQSDNLATEAVARILRRARDEALKAKIERVIGVVKSHQKKPMEKEAPLADLVSAGTLILTPQQGLGLGHAVLTGAAKLDPDEPFALIFPDEFPQEDYLSKLTAIFASAKCSVVAAGKHQVTGHWDGGVAYCRKDLGVETLAVSKFVEKPDKVAIVKNQKALPVLGRYVLTVDVITELQNDPESDGPLELTPALTRLAARNLIRACVFNRGVTPLFPTSFKRQLLNQIRALREL